MQVLVTVRYLELTSRGPDAVATAGFDPSVARLLVPSVRLARHLYTAVGRDSSWTSRSAWTDSRWATQLALPATQWWVSWSRDRITGFVELWGGQAPHGSTTYIKYLGLLPEFRHRGLGTHLVAHAARRAFTLHRRWPGLPEVHRITVDTCDVDARRALHLFEQHGFATIREEQAEQEVTEQVAERIRARCSGVGG